MLDNLDWSLVFENPGRGMILSGLWITLQIAVYGTIFSTILGILIALGRITRASALAPLRWFLTFYVEFFRNVPLVVQLAFWAFGMFSLEAVRGAASLFNGLYSNQFLAGLCGLTVYSSAYIAEALRSGFQSVPRGQLEAARASGLGYAAAMRYVIVPQVFIRVLPALGNQYVGLTKNTTVVMVVGGTGLLFQAQQIEATTFHAVEPFAAVAAIFVVLCWSEAALLNLVSKRMTRRKISRSEAIQNTQLEQV